MDRSALRYAGASRPAPGETANGDRWLVQERSGSLRVAIIDGLGHGPQAEAAALAAIAALIAAPDGDPTDALRRCDGALRGTRGAAASVLVIDPGRRTVQFAGVGNVEGRLLDGGPERHFSPDRGVLGRGIRVPHQFEFPLGLAWSVILHSDGIRDRSLPGIGPEVSPEELANQILSDAGRGTDDATVVVVTASDA